MTITIKLNGKKISLKKAKELVGEKTMAERIADAKDNYWDDPFELNIWMDGMEIIVRE